MNEVKIDGTLSSTLHRIAFLKPAVALKTCSLQKDKALPATFGDPVATRTPETSDMILGQECT